MGALGAVAACHGQGEPVPMPVAVPIGCAAAECGSGGCHEEAGGAAVCECAPGTGRTMQHQCVDLVAEPGYHGVALQDEVFGCTSPAHCVQGELCERLTGRCVARNEERCRGARNPEPGQQLEGGFCYRAHTGRQRGGCAIIRDTDLCSAELVCAPTGPFGHSVVCGAPERAVGVCRRPCELCEGGQCPEGQGCVLLEGTGGVCVPLGYTSDELCGEALCIPGESCALGGAAGGIASGRCGVPCSEEASACPDGLTCRPVREDRMPGVLFCSEDNE